MGCVRVSVMLRGEGEKIAQPLLSVCMLTPTRVHFGNVMSKYKQSLLTLPSIYSTFCSKDVSCSLIFAILDLHDMSAKTQNHGYGVSVRL